VDSQILDAGSPQRLIDPPISQKKVAQMLGIHHETVKHILRDDLNMRKAYFKRVTHAVNSSQKAVQVQVSRGSLDFLESRTDRCL
jgi:hypothetical protein